MGAMTVACDAGTTGVSNQSAPCDSEAAMLRLLQQHMATITRPFVDHVDQLFKAVESLSIDLADQRARSRKHHEEISVRLNDIDRTITLRPRTVANTVEEQRDYDVVVQGQLNQWFAEVLEPTLQEHNDRQADSLSNLEGKMQALLNSLLQPTLEQNEKMIRGQLDSFSSRLRDAEAGVETVASSVQEVKHFTDLSFAQIMKLADVERGGLKFSGLDERLSVAIADGAILTDKMEPAVEEKQREMPELKSLQQDKRSSIQGGLEMPVKPLAAANGRLAKSGNPSGGHFRWPHLKGSFTKKIGARR